MPNHTPITAVWSTYGHRFLTDGDNRDRCLTCGAAYELYRDDPTDPSHGDYRTHNGDHPAWCTGNTEWQHGPGPCDSDNGHPCEHYSDSGDCIRIAATNGCHCLDCTD